MEPAQTEWAVPVPFAAKKDGTLRFCVDYRRLNDVTIRDPYRLPRMDKRIDSLGDAKIFSTIDASSGYWQFKVDKRDGERTAFTSHHGLYQSARMPIGLRNIPAMIERVMAITLSTVKWQFALLYFGDIVIFSKTRRNRSYIPNKSFFC